MAVRIGVVFRPQLPPERLPAFVGRAEASGLDDVWLWEDCFLEGGLTSAAVALARTSSIRVGLGLMPVPLRNPALAAMEIATLARLFPGRFVPAAGHGVQSWMAQAGAAAESPMTLLREWTDAVRALLAGERVSVAGRYVRLDGVALDWPPDPPPPLYVGGFGPRTLALAGESADGILLAGDISPDGVRRQIEAAGRREGQEVVLYLAAAVGDGAAARVAADDAATGDPSAVGTPAEVADVIARYADAGADTVVLTPPDAAEDLEAVLDLAVQARALLTAGPR